MDPWQSHVHACFIEFELEASGADTVEGHGERHVEKEREVRVTGVTVKSSDPLPVAAARRIAREGSIDVAIGDDNVARLQHGEDLTLIAVGKVGAVNQGKRRGVRRRRFLPFFVERFTSKDEFHSVKNTL